MRNIQTIETVATVGADGSVRVTGLPFRPGDSVRVLVLAGETGIRRGHTQEEIELSRKRRERMKGTILKYDRPTDPAIDPEEWDAVRGDGGPL